MIILDENFPESQRQVLRGWRVPIRQSGYEVGRSGMQDEEIIPFLLQRRRVTFFTLDQGFYKRHLSHARYCLVYLDVEQSKRQLLCAGCSVTDSLIRMPSAPQHLFALHTEGLRCGDYMRRKNFTSSGCDEYARKCLTSASSLTAARERFLLNVTGLGWAANGDWER
jgi:hypothetical protein